MDIRILNNEEFMKNILNGITYDMGKQFEFNFNKHNFLISYYLLDNNIAEEP